MKKPAYTPYDGSHRLFQIGLSLLDTDRWIEPDDKLSEQLSEKRRLVEHHFDQVFRMEMGSEAAQRESLDLLIDHLRQFHPTTHRFDGSTVEMAGHKVDLEDREVPALLKAASLVQDDLLILSRKEGGWHLTAASLSFPSSWSLGEKIGKPLGDIHGPVPGFARSTRNAQLIGRIFDNLQVAAPVKRMNWSINPTDELFLPEPKSGHPGQSFKPEDSFIRVERQTLRKLAETGAILFTIRIYIDPIAEVMTSPGAGVFAGSFADQIEGLGSAQVAYKGLSGKQAALADYIRTFAR